MHHIFTHTERGEKSNWCAQKKTSAATTTLTTILLVQKMMKNTMICGYSEKGILLVVKLNNTHDIKDISKLKNSEEYHLHRTQLQFHLSNPNQLPQVSYCVVTWFLF